MPVQISYTTCKMQIRDRGVSHFGAKTFLERRCQNSSVKILKVARGPGAHQTFESYDMFRIQALRMLFRAVNA